jgi:hypothetical protein
MNHLTHEKFKELATAHNPHCISIYIPTHRSGMEVNEKIDQINLKNQVQDVANELQNWQLHSRDIEKLLGPVKELLDDSSFWNGQSEGLAIFLSPDSFDYFTLPVTFAELTYVSDHFYVLPLVSYLNDTGKFFLLSLSLSGAEFYEGLPHHLNKIDVEELLPEQMEDVIGYDFKEKHLQFRTGQTGNNNSLIHGQGKGEDEDKIEIEKFFRAINDGLMKIVTNRQRPMVIAGVDYLIPIYKSVNGYKHLSDKFIPGNPEHVDPNELHSKTKALLADHFDEDRSKNLEVFEQALSKAAASYREDDVIKEAYNKRIDTLFVKKNELMWGIFDMENYTVKQRDESRYKSCLLNFAAVHTFLNGGTVYILDENEMPEPSSRLNAVYRY